MQITAIILDKTPLIYMQEPCKKRHVTINLTMEQLMQLKLGENEEYSQVFLEEA